MSANYDQRELAKFGGVACEWWDPEGPLKTLHHINPLRLAYIKNIVALQGKTVLDMGCGGGLLTEALATEGAKVMGIDLSQDLIRVAKLHLLESKLTIDYRVVSAESLANEASGQFDVVTCLEMLEHVPNPETIVQAASTLVKPGGDVFFSTINRHPKAYLHAILGAEYLLKLLPKNTHDYAKFIRPSELTRWIRQAGLLPIDIKGMDYHPFTHQATLTDDIRINYLLHARRPHA